MILSYKHGAIIALIIANIIWGATSPIMKWAIADMNPLTLAFFRFGVATVILLPFVYKNLHIHKEDIAKMILMSFFGVTLSIGLFLMALTYTDSINAPIIGSAAPIFTIAIAMLYFGEKVGVKKIAGGIVGLLGVLTILLQPMIEKGVDSSFFGNMLLIVSTFAGVIHLFMSKKLVQTYAPLTITFYSFLFGTISFLPFFGYDVFLHSMPVFDVKNVVGILFGAIFASALAHLLFYNAERKLSASEISLFAYIPPVVTIFLAVPLLGEKLTVSYILGAILVFVGITIAEIHRSAHPFHHRR